MAKVINSKNIKVKKIIKEVARIMREHFDRYIGEAKQKSK
jgi:hypothetical protein